MTSCRASNHFKFDFNPSRRNESALIKDAECIETTLKSTHNTHQKSWSSESPRIPFPT